MLTLTKTLGKMVAKLYDAVKSLLLLRDCLRQTAREALHRGERREVWGRQDHCWSSMPWRSWPPLQLSSDTARSTSPWRNQTPATSAPCPHCTIADGSQRQVYRLLQRFPLKEKKPCLICKCIWVSICLPRNPGSEKPFLCGACGDFTGYRLPRKQRGN